MTRPREGRGRPRRSSSPTSPSPPRAPEPPIILPPHSTPPSRRLARGHHDHHHHPARPLWQGRTYARWDTQGRERECVDTHTPLTNRTGTGLRSAPRSNKATRLLTRPGRTTKSYARDSSPRAVKLQSASWDPRRASAGAPSPACSGAWPKPIRIRLRTCGKRSPRSGMDSDLEAFSHNPADGSFAALPGQTAAKTNYLNPRFLSY